jgi:hypothetical protein
LLPFCNHYYGDYIKEGAAGMKEMRNAYRILVRPRHRWEDDTKMHLTDKSMGVCAGFIWLMLGTNGRFL